MPPNEIDKLVELAKQLERFQERKLGSLRIDMDDVRTICQAASTLKALEAERDEQRIENGVIRDDNAFAWKTANEHLSENATLTARIKGLEEGLRPFAEAEADIPERLTDDALTWDGLPVSAFRLAASLLKGGGLSDANAASATCRSAPQERAPGEFQGEVRRWTLACFGERIADDKEERGDRLLEEVFEALQSGGYDPDRVVPLRDYVWGRPVGEHPQEIGGVMVTFAAYCNAYHLDMERCGEVELARVWTKVEQIRAKQAAKPTGSALPVCVSMPGDVSASDGSTRQVEQSNGLSPNSSNAALKETP